MIGGLTRFWGLVREIDLGRIRSELEQPPRLALVGAVGSGRHTLAGSLFGRTSAAWAQVLDQAAPTPAALDLVLLVLDGRATPAMATRHLAIDMAANTPLVVALTHRDQVPDPAVRDDRLAAAITAAGARGAWVDARDAAEVQAAIGPLLLEAAPLLGLALGLRVPALRGAVAAELIRDASRVNAEFALLTNLPAAIPLAGGVVGDAADLLVLTKNQAVLVFKLAGIYGRDVGNAKALAAEILPVVGGAFLWRTLARSLAGLLPPLVGVAPKTAIAFVGTYVVGQLARSYYEHGARPTAEALARFRAEGLRLYLDVAGRLGRRGRSAGDGAL